MARSRPTVPSYGTSDSSFSFVEKQILVFGKKFMYCHPTVAKPHEWLLWESTVRCEPVRFIQTNALIGNVKLV